MEEKRLVPKRRFDRFKSTWNISELEEISDLTSSKRVYSNEYVEDGIPFFRGTEITKLGNSSELEDVFYISYDHYKELKRKFGVPKIGDILITAVGTLGNVNLITNDLKFYFKDGNLIWIKNIKIDPYFLSTYLGNGKGKQRLLESAAGSNQDALTMDKMKNIFVILPSTEEQQKIGEFFKVLDERIANQERKIAKVKALKSAYLTEMFPQEGENVPKRRFKGFEGEWKKKRLNELGEILTGSTPPTNILKYYSDKGVPWVTPTDIKENVTLVTAKHLSAEGKKVARIVPENTVLVTSIASIGKNTILGTTGSFNQQINGLIPIHDENDPYFLYVASTLWSKELANKAASGTMQIVNKTEFSNLITLIPSLAEQQKMGSFFKNLDDQITTEEKKLEKLKKMKEAYLEEMFV